MSRLTDLPPCPNCAGKGYVECGGLPSLECPECLGTKRDLGEYHRRRAKRDKEPGR
jgi:hypothetical protein